MSGSSLVFYYDQLTNEAIDGSNVAAVATATEQPEFFRNNEHFIFRGYVYSDASTSTKANLSSLTMSVKIGSLGSAALMTANSASCNQSADWSNVNVAGGQICFWVNSCGSAIDTALGTTDSKQLYCNINGLDSSSDDRTIAQFAVKLMNTPD